MKQRNHVTDERESNDDQVPQYPVDGILDLHTFHPRDAADVTHEYLKACHTKGIYRVRIIHGKGKGVLRTTVHATLACHPLVESWRTPTDSSGWGATIVQLKPQID